MRRNRDEKLLERIIGEIIDIESFTRDIFEEQFMHNIEKQKAVCLSFQNIGEYVKNISKELKLQHENVQWTEIYGFRNIVAHEYANIKMSDVWLMVKEDLYQLKEDVENIIRNF